MTNDCPEASALLAETARRAGPAAALEQALTIIAGLEAELRAAGQVKTDFMARMTHEMRTPLSAIIGLTRLSRPRTDDAPLRDYLQKILDAATVLLGVIDDITDFSKLEKGLAELVAAPFDLAASLSRVRQRFAAAALAKGLALDVRLDPLLPVRLVGDSARLEGVLGHLVGNAVKFTETGRVDMTVDLLWRRGGEVRLRFGVRDTGIGLEQAAIPAVLESFTQGDGSLSRPYGGTGLGLALVRHGAALLGGELAIDSRPGAGAAFSFEATFAEDRGQAPAGEPAPPRAASPAASANRPLAGAVLLLVEDNAINQQVAREVLQGQGATVHVAANGREAVDMAGATPYDAVLMDVQMPIMDGLAATRAIRAQPGGAELPIIALTAHALAEDRDRCLAAGMNDYLTKPVEPDRLLAALGQWIATAAVARVPAPAACAAAPSGLDVARALARLGGNEALLAGVAATFVRDYADSAREIAGLLRAGDLTGARRLAHTVKGVAGNIAAESLAAAAAALETALAAGARPGAGTLDAYARALAATVAAASRLRRPEHGDRTPLRVLLVDDAKLNRAIFSRILEEAGHEVVAVANGKQACRALFGDHEAGRPFDCILMDVEMPEMDGLTASRMIRGLLAGSVKPPCAASIPILALTSHEADAERERCLAAGMNACLSKTFEHEAVLDALARFAPQAARRVCRPSARPAVAGPALAPILRGLAVHLKAGNIRADEDLDALRQVLDDRPPPPALDALGRAVERYAFAEALGLLEPLARELGLDPASLDVPAGGGEAL